MDRHGDDGAGEAGEVHKKALTILASEHADDEYERPRNAPIKVGQSSRHRAAAVRIVAAVQPEFGAVRRHLSNPTADETLHARGPFDARDPLPEGCVRNLQRRKATQCCYRCACVVDLMVATQTGHRQVQDTVPVTEHHVVALRRYCPVLAANPQRCAETRRLPLDHRERPRRLRRDYCRHTALEDAGLLGRDQFNRIAKELLMVMRNGSDDCRKRAVHHVGRVKPSTEADFKQKHIGGIACKEQKSRRRGDFKERDRIAGIQALAGRKGIHQFVILNQHAATRPCKTDALVEANQMRRGVNMHAEPGRFQDCTQKSSGRTLAIGAGDVDHWRQAALGMTEPIQNAPHAVEREIDPFGM